MAVRMKNSTITTWPSGMAWNTMGMVMNSRDAPASGWKPKANTAGKIASPARIDTS
jgi:hypothetical protein